MRLFNDIRIIDSGFSCPYINAFSTAWESQTPFRFSKELLRECFDYDENSGMLMWKRGYNVGKEAGYNPKNGGYRRITIRNGKLKSVVELHKAIWVYFNGPTTKGLVIDHKDRNYYNNRIENLHEVTLAQNSLNVWFDKTKSNTGFKNIVISGNRYRNRYRRYDKSHKTIEEAIIDLAEIYKNCPDIQLLISRNVYLNYYEDTLKAADKILSSAKANPP